MEKMSTHILMFDGGSRGNPGKAGCGYVICSSHDVDETQDPLIIGYEYLGVHQTNNYAEYSGLIRGLEVAISHGLTTSDIQIEGDSLLVIQQLSGKWKVKNENLKPLYEKARLLLSQLHSYSFTYIPRSKNKMADSLANKAMDEECSSNIHNYLLNS